jgi:type I restriction enzyme S subunit
MVTEWRQLTIGQLINEKGGSIKTGPFGTALKANEYSTEGVPLISVREVGYGSLRVDDSTPRVPPAVTERLSEYLLRPGDIVFGRKGAVDRSAYVNEDQDGWFLGSDGIRLRLPETCDSRFMAYQVRSPNARNWLIQHATGTTMASLNQGVIERLPIIFPPIEKQRAIAHILGTLDDKIELNRRMNATLETMARAIFKSWFVDFDPVRAKAEGRAPEGLDSEIAALFPDGFEDSELGEIPKRWEIGRLEDVLVLQRGFDLPTTQRTLGPYPVIAASGYNGSHNEFMVKGPGVTTGRSGVLGKVFYVHEDFWPLNTSLWVKQFKRSTPAYAFHLLSRLDFGIFNAGSAVPTLNRNHVHNLPTLLPPVGVIHAFENIAVTLLKRQQANDNESSTLAALRDTLLPKLLSGELRVKAAEQLVEAAA